MKEEGRASGEIAAYLLAYVRDTLAALTRAARSRYPGIPVLFAGGVMSCRRFREDFLHQFDASFAEPAFSSDNAAGVALLCEEQYRYDCFKYS